MLAVQSRCSVSARSQVENARHVWERQEVVVLRGTLDERTNLGWQLMRMPVTTPPGCVNSCNYADFIQSGQSVVLSFILYVR
ncbi:hypothetical protein LR48_Vigan97s001900 [Vigna angularis]|uniref:Uncharacterized protein n=1 Tax=Phaseolus angularis TaxID=3914 RepID=A0A0L9T5E5_PHAAN|nr:hypothetical protein LR48_Vigan97s001900 [Vigna angularis]